MGGTTEWKTGVLFKNGSGPAAQGYYDIITEAKERGKPVHIGRVNSFERMDASERLWMASSADGTFVAHGPAKNTPQILQWLDAMNAHGVPSELAQKPEADAEAYDTAAMAVVEKAEKELIITKTRCPQLTGAVIPKPGIETARVLRDWLAVPNPSKRSDAQQAALEQKIRELQPETSAPPSDSAEPDLTKRDEIRQHFAVLRETIGETRWSEELGLAGVRDPADIRYLNDLRAFYRRLAAIARKEMA